MCNCYHAILSILKASVPCDWPSALLFLIRLSQMTFNATSRYRRFHSINSILWKCQCAFVWPFPTPDIRHPTKLMNKPNILLCYNSSCVKCPTSFTLYRFISLHGLHIPPSSVLYRKWNVLYPSGAAGITKHGSPPHVFSGVVA